ncbi:MAG: hypothetical protein V8S34_08010 [Lawsonibacter sp.]
MLDHSAIQLALWMRERYFCTVYDCVKAMLPAGSILRPAGSGSWARETARKRPIRRRRGRRRGSSSSWTCCMTGAEAGIWNRSVWPLGPRTPIRRSGSFW